jgi:polyisoprenyl-phosphate glycosyltransferase
MDISIIIPVFRGNKTIIPLFNKIKAVLDSNYEFEVLFIEDSGCNNCVSEITEIIIENPKCVKGFKLEKNNGQHKAILFGFSKAEGEFIITMDEDLQHDPEDILKLLSKQHAGNYDVVYGRFKNKKYTILRRLSSYLFRNIIKLLIPKLYINYSPYRLIKKKTAVQTLVLKTPYVFIDEYLSCVTNKFASVDVSHYEGPLGRSSYSIIKLFLNALLALLSYSKLVLLTFTIGAMLTVLYFLQLSINLEANNKLFFIGLLLLIFGGIGITIRKHNEKVNTGSLQYDEVNPL